MHLGPMRDFSAENSVQRDMYKEQSAQTEKESADVIVKLSVYFYFQLGHFCCKAPRTFLGRHANRKPNEPNNVNVVFSKKSSLIYNVRLSGRRSYGPSFS